MAGLREAYLNKTGQFAKPAEKSKSAPVVAAFSLEITAINEEEPMNDSLPSDFLFASIEDVLTFEELGCIVNTNVSTLLDSGASSHIIKDLKYFWNYDHEGAKSVKTANHGTVMNTVSFPHCHLISTMLHPHFPHTRLTNPCPPHLFHSCFTLTAHTAYMPSPHALHAPFICFITNTFTHAYSLLYYINHDTNVVYFSLLFV
jgi:hypothetical protein